MKEIKKSLSILLVIVIGIFLMRDSALASGDVQPKALILGNSNIQVNLYDSLYGQGNNGTNVSILTDGNKGNATNWADFSSWLKIYRNSGRNIVIDMGKVNTVNKLSMYFGQRTDVGITAPPYVKYYVSNDGVNYSYLGKAEPDMPLYIENTTAGQSDIDTRSYTLQELPDGTSMNVQARYIKVSFLVDVWAWASELEATGYEGIVNGAVIPASFKDDVSDDVNKYPAKGTAKSAGISDQFLMYSGKYTPLPDATSWTKDSALTILGYKDKNGEIKDWLFKDILLLPVSAINNPSGNGKFTTMEDYLSFLDFIFAKGNQTQLEAMDLAAGEINAKLGTNNKVKVTVSIPMMDYNCSNFGDIYGDGRIVSLNPKDFSSLAADPNSTEGKIKMMKYAMANREKLVQWYINEVEKRFNEAGYKNLSLENFYWNNESVKYATNDNELIKSTSKYLKKNGYGLTWIPYIGTAAPYIWKEAGFSTMALQPNYAFWDWYPKDILTTTAALARRTGGAVEIELGSNYAKFAKYLNAGINSSFMNDSYHAYYLGSRNLLDDAVSTNPALRGIYDNLYAFIKGTYVRKYTMEIQPDLTDKTNIVVPSVVKLAEKFTEGRYTITFDTSKVDYKYFELSNQLAGKATINVVNEPGKVTISFKINDPRYALNGDYATVGGVTQIGRAYFSKKANADDAGITPNIFGLDTEGIMKDAAGTAYLDWNKIN